MSEFNYERAQCVRIGQAPSYGIKLDNNADGCPGTPHRGHVSSDWSCPLPNAKWLETKRMIVTADKFRRIMEILSE